MQPYQTYSDIFKYIQKNIPTVSKIFQYFQTYSNIFQQLPTNIQPDLLQQSSNPHLTCNKYLTKYLNRFTHLIQQRDIAEQ